MPLLLPQYDLFCICVFVILYFLLCICICACVSVYLHLYVCICVIVSNGECAEMRNVGGTVAQSCYH